MNVKERLIAAIRRQPVDRMPDPIVREVERNYRHSFWFNPWATPLGQGLAFGMLADRHGHKVVAVLAPLLGGWLVGRAGSRVLFLVAFGVGTIGLILLR